MYTDPHETDELFVAHRLVGFVVGRRTLGAGAVAKGRVTTSIVIPALDTVPQLAIIRTARPLNEAESNN